VNWLSLSSYIPVDLSPLSSDVWGPRAGRSGLHCGRSSNSSGRLSLRRSGLVSIRFTRHSSLGPRRDDLANNWAHGPFVRSLILLVDPGDIRPPQAPNLCVDFEITGPKIQGPACSFIILIRNDSKISLPDHYFWTLSDPVKTIFYCLLPLLFFKTRCSVLSLCFGGQHFDFSGLEFHWVHRCSPRASSGFL
jgi:hypothetical protein